MGLWWRGLPWERLLCNSQALSHRLFLKGKRELTWIDCRPRAAHCAKPFPFPFSLNPCHRQERKALTLYKEAKAQSNLKLAHSDTGHGGTGLLASWAPTKLDLLPERYRLEESAFSRTVKRSVDSSTSPGGFGPESTPNSGAAITLSPTWVSPSKGNRFLPRSTNLQDFNRRSRRENYIFLTNEYWEIHLHLECP